jgi:hypothetical protein
VRNASIGSVVGIQMWRNELNMERVADEYGIMERLAQTRGLICMFHPNYCKHNFFEGEIDRLTKSCKSSVTLIT